MEKNEDLLITNHSFINFLLHDDSKNTTNFSWNASSTTKFSHNCLNSLACGYIDIKTYSNESMVILLNTLYQLDKEIQQEYRGPTEINSIIIELSSIKADKLLKFLQSKKQINPPEFFLYYKIIEEFLSYCSLCLNKSSSTIYDIDLFDKKLFYGFISREKLPINKIYKFKKIYSLYFSKDKFPCPLNTEKEMEEFNHVVLERHLDEVRKKRTKRTVKNRKNDYRKFFNWLRTAYVEFHNYSLNSIPLYLVNANHLEDYKVFLMKQFQSGIYKKQTISDIFYNIRSLFEALYQMKTIPNDITINISSIKFEKYKYRDLPSNQDLSGFLNAVMCYTPEPLKFCIAYKLMIYLGLRLSEVAYLESSNINFGTNTISVKGKGDKYDILPLPNILLDDLNCLIKLNKKYVFSDKPQIFKNNLYLYYKLISFILNWNFSGGVHIFRHTFITRLSEQPNLPPQIIQFLSRHVRPDTTSLYIHRDDKSLNNAINKINYF